MSTPTSERRRWGISISLGRVLRRGFVGSETDVTVYAQNQANLYGLSVDYWDEADTSASPGVPAKSLRTLEPIQLKKYDKT